MRAANALAIGSPEHLSQCQSSMCVLKWKLMCQKRRLWRVCTCALARLSLQTVLESHVYSELAVHVPFIRAVKGLINLHKAAQVHLSLLSLDNPINTKL